MTHTPGPWTVDRAWHIDKGFLRIIRDPRLERVAMIPDVERELEEAIGDAHLIAAAPDLLDALRSIAEHSQEFGGLEDAETMLVRIAEKARAAIAKTEGQA